ncbi:hypothetical protein MNKW57_05500 [Biformimicrobium ophioploci]|uniref:Uncharacterized protein n=2 Tax=Biformimicrobium ophioploci TaxID=3036711 RepID=A0ABQ6LVV9_9GAMM|nr:hypothetical protein MNKW57_05500 [Microbulbifer sp. NKW57]
MWEGNHTVTADQVEWVPSTIAIPGNIHRRYPDGSEVILEFTNAGVIKVRIDDGRWEQIDELVIPEQRNHRAAPERIRKLREAMDGNWMEEDKILGAFREYLGEVDFSKEIALNGLYTVLDNEGFAYAGYDTTLYKVGDDGEASADAKIKIERKLDLRKAVPPELADSVTRFLGVNLTYDGYIVVALPGLIAVLSRDFEQVYTAPITGEAVDNGIAIDPEGGIYVVTDKYMRKMVWTGSSLSMDPADGAWKEPYAYKKDKPGLWLSRGSGATPTLMGYGEDADRLVLIPDAGDPVKLLAYWRDKIPDDAKQLPGRDSKRLAGEIAVGFPVDTTIEWSFQVYGSGVMALASDFPDPITTDGDRSLLTTLVTMGYTRKAPRGAENFSWDAQSNTLKRDWLYDDRTVTWTMTPVSTANNATYLNTLQGGEWIIVGVDWDTGEKVAEIKLPPSYIFNALGGFHMPMPDGDIFVSGMFGPVRIKAKK